MKYRQNGFTVIELLLIVVILTGASILFFVQKNNLVSAAADTQRKTAINAMYYSLEEVYYPVNGFYPQTISAEILPSVDPDLFTDPSGNKLGDSASNYRYEPTNCTDGRCKSYTLRSTLASEADFIKENKKR